MSPILQSRANASAIGYGAFSVAAAAGDFESIATVSVGSGGAANVEFTSIPGTYTHLQIRGIGKSTSSPTDLDIQFNSDTGSNYRAHRLYGDGSSVVADVSTQTTRLDRAGFLAGGTSVFAANIIDILDYTNTNKYTTVRSLYGYDNNGSGYQFFSSGLWMNTNAITSIKLYPDAGNFVQYTTFALYGIKGA